MAKVIILYVVIMLMQLGAYAGIWWLFYPEDYREDSLLVVLYCTVLAAVWPIVVTVFPLILCVTLFLKDWQVDPKIYRK